MKNKYIKQREKKDEDSKQKESFIIEKPIKFNHDIKLNHSKSPKSPRKIIKNLGLLKMFNKFLFEKETKQKRENSVRNVLNIRRINKIENDSKVKSKEIKVKEDNININLKY